jgi:hypothetical protein
LINISTTRAKKIIVPAIFPVTAVLIPDIYTKALAPLATLLKTNPVACLVEVLSAFRALGVPALLNTLTQLPAVNASLATTLTVLLNPAVYKELSNTPLALVSTTLLASPLPAVAVTVRRKELSSFPVLSVAGTLSASAAPTLLA